MQPVVEQNLGRSLFGGLRDLAGVSLQGGTVFDFEREFGEK